MVIKPFQGRNMDPLVFENEAGLPETARGSRLTRRAIQKLLFKILLLVEESCQTVS